MPNTCPMMFAAVLVASFVSSWVLGAEAYPQMAPVEQYRLPSREAEMALALSAAPRSIADNAGVLVLGKTGYESARNAKNGFTCLVERSWGADFDDPEFWNPKIRGPLCFNAAAMRSVYPSYRMRTEWVLAGIPREELLQRTRTAVAAKEIMPPEPGAMCYMMSKDGYLGDSAGGHWHPHLMFYFPHLDAADWGAGFKGSPVLGGPLLAEPASLFMVPVTVWSDGSSEPMSH
jgi:hypothetical protein